MLAAASDSSTTDLGGSLAAPDVPGILLRAGTRFRVRRGQRLPERHADDLVHYFVCDGSLYLQNELPERRRAIVATYYPGEFCSMLMAGEGDGESLMAAEAGTVVRVKADTVGQLASADPHVSARYGRWMEVRAARVEAHAIVVGRLTGEERVAAYLVEAVQMRGETHDKAIQVDLPFSREEVADYLALNPDTLSRFLTRMKADGLVTFLGHRRAVVTDWRGLLQRCPISDLLLKVYQR